MMQTVYILSQTGCITSEFELDEEMTDLSDEPGDDTHMLKSCECVLGKASLTGGYPRYDRIL